MHDTIQRQAGHSRCNSGYFPSTEHLTQDRRGHEALFRIRHFVDIARLEDVRAIKARHRPLYRKVVAHLRQVYGIAVVGRVCEVLRPRIRQLRRQAMHTLHTQRTDQRVIAEGRRRLPICD